MRRPSRIGHRLPIVPLTIAVVTGSLGVSAVTARPVEAPRVRVLPSVLTPIEATPTPTPTVEPTAPPPAPAAPRPAAPRVRRAAVAAPKPVPRGPRGWIEIPSIGASAPVLGVGLDGKGNMVTPKSARDIAWLDNGSFPGPTRNAVLAGHRNWKGASGTLERLERAQPGDIVRVRIDGQQFAFSIVWVRIYDPDNAPVEELLGETAVDSVTIVTCGGPFNRSTRHYEQRVVARAEIVSA